MSELSRRLTEISDSALIAELRRRGYVMAPAARKRARDSARRSQEGRQ